MRKAFDNLDASINIIASIMSTDIKNNSAFLIEYNNVLFVV